MPPHCDSLDGPVVTAARDALAREDVDRILPFVKHDGEAEVRAAFDLAVKARAQGAEARQVADRYFFEMCMSSVLVRCWAGAVPASRTASRNPASRQ